MRLPCMPRKDQFRCYCWSCSLQTGTVLVGWIGVVTSIILLLECIATLLDIVHLKPEYNPPIVVAVVGFSSLIVNSFLIYGARSENPLLMLPCMLFSLVIFTAMSALSVYILLRAYITVEPAISVTLTVICVLVIVIAFHVWAGIYSYYQDLEEKLRPPPDFQLENLAFEKDMEQPELYGEQQNLPVSV